MDNSVTYTINITKDKENAIITSLKKGDEEMEGLRGLVLSGTDYNQDKFKAAKELLNGKSEPGEGETVTVNPGKGEKGKEEVKDEFELTIERNNGKTTIIGVGGTSAEKYKILEGVVLTGGNEDDVAKFNEAKEGLSNVAVGETVAEETSEIKELPEEISDKEGVVLTGGNEDDVAKFNEAKEELSNVAVGETVAEETSEIKELPEEISDKEGQTIANGIIKEITKFEQKYKDKITNYQLKKKDLQDMLSIFENIQKQINTYYIDDKTYDSNKRILFNQLNSSITGSIQNINRYNNPDFKEEYLADKKRNYIAEDLTKFHGDIIRILQSIPDEMFNEQPLHPKGGSSKNRTQKRRGTKKPRKGGKSRRNVHKK